MLKKKSLVSVSGFVLLSFSTCFLIGDQINARAERHILWVNFKKIPHKDHACLRKTDARTTQGLMYNTHMHFWAWIVSTASCNSQQHCTKYTLPKMSPYYCMRQTAWAIFLNETTCTCPFLMRVSSLVKHWNPRSSLTCKITEKQADTPTQMPPHKHTHKQVCILCFSTLPLFLHLALHTFWSLSE